MSVIIQIEKDGKRMCVYSQRDFEYMVGKGWKPFVATPIPEPVKTPDAEDMKGVSEAMIPIGRKKPGRPAKVKH